MIGNISKDQVLANLRTLKPELSVKYKVSNLELFGSFVRGEQHGESDIDILVEFSKEADMFDLIALEFFLEEKLGRKVDVVPKRAIRAELQSSVFTEAIVV